MAEEVVLNYHHALHLLHIPGFDGYDKKHQQRLDDMTAHLAVLPEDNHVTLTWRKDCFCGICPPGQPCTGILRQLTIEFISRLIFLNELGKKDNEVVIGDLKGLFMDRERHLEYQRFWLASLDE